MKEVKRWFSLFLAFAMLMTALSVNTMPAMAEVSWTDLWSGDGWTLGEENGEPIYSAPNELYRLSYTGSLDGMNTVEGDIRIDSIGVDFGNLSLGLGMADGKKRFFSYTHGTKTMRVFDQNDALQASVEMDNALPVGEYTHWKMQWNGVKMTLFINDEKVMDYNYAAAGLRFEAGATCWISEWYHAATVKNLSVKHVELPVSWTDLWSGDGWTLGEENGEPIYSAPNELYRLSYTGSLDGMNTVEGDIRIDSIGADYGNISMQIKAADGKGRYFSYTHGTKTMRVFDQNDALQASVEMENALPVGEYTHWKMQWDGVKMTLFINDKKVMDYNYAAAGLRFEAGATCLISEWFHAATVKNLSVKHVELPVSWTDLWSGDGWTLGEENGEPIYSAPNELYRLSYTGSLDGMNTVEGDIRIDSIGVDYGNLSLGLGMSDGKKRFFSYTHGTKTMRVFDQNDALQASVEMENALPVGEYTHWKMQWNGVKMTLFINDKKVMDYNYAAAGLRFEAGATCWISEWFHAATVKNLSVKHVELPVSWTDLWSGDGWTLGEENGEPIYSAPNELYRLSYTGSLDGMNTVEGDIRIDSIGVDYGNISMQIKAADGKGRYFSYTHGTGTMRLYDENDVLVTALVMPEALPVGEFTHWKMQWDGTRMVLYVNGKTALVYDYAADGLHFEVGATCLISEWFHAATVKNLQVSNSTVEEPVDPVERWDMSVWQWDDTWVKGVDSATSTEILKTDSELTRIRYTGDFVDKNSIGGDVRIDRRFWDGPGNVGISVTSDQNTEYFAWYNQFNNTITLYRNDVSVGSKQLPDPISLGEWFHLEVSWNDRYLGVFVNNVQRISYECAKDGDTFGGDATALLSEWGQPVSLKNMKVEKSEKQIYKNFALSSVFGNGMLFQRRKPVKVFGQGGEIGDTVRVEFAGQTKTATVTDAGEWFVYLDKMEANAVGQTMTVSYTRAGTVNAAEILRVENIVVGELWLASGQSNMMYEIGWLRETDKDRNYLKPYDEISNLDKLRYFYVTPTYADEPTNYSATTGWVTPVSGNIEGFSATSLGFAAQLQLSLGEDVPVGIIQCALNGSFIEEWLDASTLEKTGSTHKGIQSRLYNGMVYGIKGMSIAGILWYQGEANAFANGMYTTQMEAYIRLYRTLFEDEKLPVVLFQLPQYNEQAIEKAWPIFRQTQWDLMKNENVYAVTGIDLGDPFNIHPSDKWPFSGRAAGVALKYIYGVKDSELHPNQKAYGFSPYISSADWTEEGILLSFDDATILTAAGNYIGGFEGFNGTGWIPLDAMIRGNQILLTGNHKEITELRYLQRSFFSGNIFVYNEYGLPIAPFASVRRTAPADTKPGQKKVIDFGSKDDLKLFRTYIADGSKAAVEEGMLCTKAGTETKIILKNYISAANMDICVDILPGTANGSMNGGLYLLASAAGSAQDQITAWNVQAERGAGNRNLVVGLHRFDSVNGWQRAYVSVCLYDYFAESEIKEPVRLRVVVKDGKLAAYVDGKLLWENLDVGDLSCGGIGIRSQDASMKFDNFTYTTDASAAIPGDVNGDGVVNSADARLVLQCVVKLSMLTDDKFKIADINGDGRVDSADAREILQISVGLT